jgi:hypothetical protein
LIPQVAVPLPVRTLEPFEGLIFFAAPRVGFGDLMRDDIG